MKIEVITDEKDPEKKRGDLLEKITKELLESQNYVVETEVRKTGIELDLLCKNKANISKKIYVECKAYCEEKKKVNADVIKNLVGARIIYGYEETWLVTTSELGKEAKGLIDKIENSTDSRCFTVYTPQKLIEAFINSNIIKDKEIAKKTILETVKDEHILGDFTFLITEYGYFWATKLLSGGQPRGILFTHADTGELIKDEQLLTNLANTNSSFRELDFKEILNFTDNYRENQLRTVSITDFKLNNEYLAEINDIGMRITHPQKENLLLEDIFIYPDLERHEKGKDRSINSKDLLNPKNELKKCLILGEDMSGKTSLALNLQKDLNTEEILPLYIKAEEIKNSDFNKFTNLLIKKFETQYNRDKRYVESFKILINEDRLKVAIFIDDLELLGIRRENSKLAFLEMLKENFEYIFIFANKSLEIETIAKNETSEMFRTFEIFKIKQLGHVLKDALIDKWLTVEDGESITDGELLDKKTEIAEKVKTACGVNFIPTYPLYIITLLQLIETGDKSKLQGSSYAELYRYLVNQSLSNVNAKPEDLDFYHTYLSYVAYSFFIKRKKGLEEEDMIEMYNEYSEIMEIDKDFYTVQNLLVKAKLLRNENGIYRFNHNYSYYFFIAKYLSDNMDDGEIKNKIDEIIERLYQSECANIIIFLIHHSKNKDIIDKIIKKSKELFSEIAPYTLSDKETDKINSLIQEEISVLIDDKSPTEHRKERLTRQDKIDDDEDTNGDEELEYVDEVKDLDLFGKVNLSFKLMEILGQIAKNNYGSLKGYKKGEILDETYSVGFRSLNAFLENFEKYLETIKSDTEDILEKKENISKGEKEIIQNKIIYSFMEMIIFLFVKEISNSVASRNLFPSIEKMTDKNDNPGTKIVNMAVKLNFPNGLNTNKIYKLDQELEKNFLTKRLLRLLVVEHLYKFDVKCIDKQSVCGKLKIGIRDKELITKKMAKR